MKKNVDLKYDKIKHNVDLKYDKNAYVHVYKKFLFFKIIRQYTFLLNTKMRMKIQLKSYTQRYSVTYIEYTEIVEIKPFGAGLSTHKAFCCALRHFCLLRGYLMHAVYWDRKRHMR